MKKNLFTIIAKIFKVKTKETVEITKRDSKGRFVKGNKPWNKGIKKIN